MLKILVILCLLGCVGLASAQDLPATTGTLVGRVVYPDGQPASGIYIAAEMQRAFQWELVQKGVLPRKPGGTYADRAVEFIQTQNSVTALTQKDGSFRLTGLTTAPYNLKITSRPGAIAYYLLGMPDDWTAPAAEGVWAKAGETRRRTSDIVLTRGALIEGRVTDQNGRPLVGIEVASYGPHRPKSGDSAAAAISDANGHYATRVPPGTIELYIAGPFDEFPPTTATLNARPQKLTSFGQLSLPVVTGKTYRVDYTLQMPVTKK